MPLNANQIERYLSEDIDVKENQELFDLIVARVNQLCFDECQIDRIACTLQPKCYRRWLLKLRLLNGLSIEDQPKFCYSVHKNIVLRDFLNKTVVYKPNDAYLYLIDFFDVFFHGDYRKLNKFISKSQFNEAKEIFDDRIHNRNENFQYIIIENNKHMVFKYEDKIHVAFLEEKYALCNANREAINDLDLLYGLCKLFARLFFPEVDLKLYAKEKIQMTTIIPKEILKNISSTPPESDDLKKDHYLWNVFPNDLDALSQYCEAINLNLDEREDLSITLSISLYSNQHEANAKPNPIRYRDMRLIFNIIFRLYNDFYILWI
jgi:hypothetical protein